MEYNLNDVFEFIRNGANIKQFDTKIGYPITRIETIANCNIDIEKMGYANIKELGKYEEYLLRDGDILMSHINSEKHLGKSAIYENLNKDIIHGMNLLCLRPNKMIGYPKYLNYFFNSKEFRRQLPKITKKSVNQASFSVSDLKKLKVSLPDIEIQQKIVEVLDKSQELINKRKEQIEALDELVKSKFIEMFGDPITNPKRWNSAKLGDICKISRGGSPRPIEKFLGGPIPWIKIGDATKGEDIYIYKTKEGIIEEGIKKSRLIKKGGLIFANCGVSLGFARILKIDGCIHDGWLAFEDFNEYLDKIFFLKSLNYCTEYFRRTAPDGTQPNLNTNIMREYIQILPPMELQREFNNFIKQVDEMKLKMEKSLKELEDNFNSLMQKAFKGELF